MIKRIIIFMLLLYGVSVSQDNGFVKFNADKMWIIEINDTLIASDQVIKLKSKIYNFKARPQISYSWPTILVEGELNVAAGDTTFYQLEAKNSTVKNPDISVHLPKTTSYKNRSYQDNPSEYPKLKTGLILTSIAANWLAFYFKREADDNYRKYGYASNLSHIKKYYKRAGDFDSASNVMLAISAATLSGYIYIALTE